MSIDQIGWAEYVISDSKEPKIVYPSYNLAKSAETIEKYTEQATEALREFFEVYEASEIDLVMALDEETRLNECIINGISEHFMAKAYRGYAIAWMKRMYKQIALWDCTDSTTARYDGLLMQEKLVYLLAAFRGYENE